jgi:translation elongation factor EF-4
MSLTPRLGAKIASHWSGKKYDVVEVGIMHPEEVPSDCLFTGQVGYLACNMKQSSEGFFFIMEVGNLSHLDIAHIGDTFHQPGDEVQPMPGFKPVQPMVMIAAGCVTHRL